jgi:hypothetical protein
MVCGVKNYFMWRDTQQEIIQLYRDALLIKVNHDKN